MHRTLLVLSACLGFATVAAADVQWVRTNPGGGGAFLAAAGGPDGTIVVGSDLSGAYLSRDRGATWSVIGPLNGMDATHVSEVRFDPTDGDTLFIGTNKGLYRSSDGGLSFALVLDRPLVPGESYQHSAAYVTQLRHAPSNPDVVYAAVHLKISFGASAPPFDGYVYRSDDGGTNWARVSEPSLPLHSDIVKLTIDPGDSTRLYALTGPNRSLEDVIGGKLYLSTDSGVSWVGVQVDKEPIMDIAIRPTDADEIWLTRYDSGTNLEGTIYRSIDGGANYSVARDGYSGVLRIDPDTPGHVRVLDPRRAFPWWEKSGTWETHDDGANWQRVPDPFSCPPGTPGNDQKSPICAWDEHWLEYVLDHPQTYGKAFSGYVATLGEDLSDPDSWLWVNSQWVYLSDDGGARFRNVHGHEPVAGSDWWRSRGVDNVNMLDLEISAADPDRVYLGLFDMGCWRSLDGGRRWQSCNPTEPIPGTTNEYWGWSGGKGGNVAAIVADPTRADTVWSTMSLNQRGQHPTYLLRSDAAGERTSWVDSGNGLPNVELMGLSIDPSSPANARTLFITAAGEIYRSVDDGASWSALASGCDGGCRVTAVDRIDGSRVYAGGETGLFRSTDGGESWTSIGLAEMRGRQNADLTWVGFWEWRWYGIFDIETHPTQQGTLLVSSFGPGRGLYRSTDGGDSWDTSPGNDCPGAGEPKILCDDQMRGIALSPLDPDLIWVGSSLVFKSGGGVGGSRGALRSTDGGASWSEQNQGLDWPLAIPIEIDPTDPSVVFVGSPGIGYARTACSDDADCDGQLDPEDCRPSDPNAGAPVAPQLRFEQDPQHLVWDATLFAAGYEVARSSLADLAAASPGSCSGAPAPGFVDADSPAPGEAFVYLVRGVGEICASSASWGQDSTGQERVGAICP